MGKHPHVQFVLLNRVPWDVILDGSHLASAAEEERRRGKNNRKRGTCLAVTFLRYKIERGSDAGSGVKIISDIFVLDVLNVEDGFALHVWGYLRVH